MLSVLETQGIEIAAKDVEAKNIEAKNIEAIERATLAAVPPQVMNEAALGRWLVPVDPGTVGRAHSAVPLAHADADGLDQLVAQVETMYASAGLAPAWRLPELPSFDQLRTLLQNQGYQSSQPTVVQVGLVANALGFGAQQGTRIDIQPHPSADWQSVYLGPGFDAADAASRIDILSRGKHTHYAVLFQDEQAVASGALSLFSQAGLPRWASIHGMRCAQHARRQGLATAVVRALAAFAHQQGFERWFLQVEQGNLGAQAVYARLGFETAWAYQYWRNAR